MSNDKEILKEKSKNILLEKYTREIKSLKKYKQNIQKLAEIIPHVLLISLIVIYIIYLLSLFLLYEYSTLILLLNWALTISFTIYLIIFYYSENPTIKMLKKRVISYLYAIQGKLDLRDDKFIQIYSIIDDKPILILRNKNNGGSGMDFKLDYPSTIITEINGAGLVILPVVSELLNKIEKNAMIDLYRQSFRDFKNNIKEIIKSKYNLMDDLDISDILNNEIKIFITNNKFINEIDLIEAKTHLKYLIGFPICELLIIMLVKNLNRELIFESIEIDKEIQTTSIVLKIGNKL